LIIPFYHIHYGPVRHSRIFYYTKDNKDYTEDYRNAKKISNGKLGVKIDSLYKDELGELAVAVNKITSNLENKIKELEYSHSVTRELFDKIGHTLTAGIPPRHFSGS